MREIKFRAWDGKRMTKSGIMFNNSNGCLTVPNSLSFNEGNLPTDLQYHLMQFTGLHDRNGAEIYEGDILKTHDEIVKVYFNEAMACFDIEYEGGDTEALVPPMGEWVEKHNEIIGNIYENPELIK